MMEELISILESRYPLIGLTASDIKKIEDVFSISLPIDYIRFLSTMGAGAGDFMRGEDIFYDRIFELREYAEELLEDDGNPFQLEKSCFVFYCHQGYYFAFFNMAEGENPQVDSYMEGDLMPKAQYPNFQEFLRSKVYEQVRFQR